VNGTQFEEVMQLINIVPVMGQEFAIFFPLLLIVFCALNYFNIYGRCMNFLGMSQFSFSDSFGTDKLNEGRSLLQKARVEKERSLGLAPASGSAKNWELSSRPLTTADYQKSDLY
jgi:hypothetical protein